MTADLAAPPAVSFRSAPRIAAAVAIALGVLALAGWLFGVRVLMQVLPGFVAMAPNAAVGFVLTGFSLWLQAGKRNGRSLRASRAAAAAAGLLGLLTVAEYLLGLSFGLDTFLFRDTEGLTGPFPCRMAFAASVQFPLLGAALVLTSFSRARRLAQSLAAIVGLIAVLSLEGYVYGVRALYAIGFYKGISLHAALAFLVLSIGVLLLRDDFLFPALIASDTAGGMVARWGLPVALGIPLILGWLCPAGERAGLYGADFGLALLSVADAVFLMAALLGIAVALKRGEEEHRRAVEEVRLLNVDLEKRVEQRTAQLETVNRELDSFAYSVSHDLRAPLRAIVGFSQLLEEDCGGRLDAEGHRDLAEIVAGTQAMGHLIDSLLKLSRVSRGELRRERVDLSEIARDVAARHRCLEPDRQVDVVVASGVVAEGDPDLFRVALENLLGNAFKFTAGKPAARVEFGVDESGKVPVYFVRDNGAGFDPAYSGKLFGAFQRLHTEAEFPGMGIGLATVQRILGRHGGRAWAEGRVDQGATFYFTVGKERSS